MQIHEKVCRECKYYYKGECTYAGDVWTVGSEHQSCKDFEQREVFKLEELPENQELVSKAEIMRIINAENAAALCAPADARPKTIDCVLVSICSEINGLPVFRQNIQTDTPTDTSNLKPCPFCGGEAKLYIRTMKGITQEQIEVSAICHECGIQRTSTIQGGCPFERIIEVKNKTVEKWNRRAGNADS